jgi:hypothetical protein
MVSENNGNIFDQLGQRGLSAFLTGFILVVLYLIAAATGRNPLELPVAEDGVTVITPEFILSMLGPAVMLVYTLAKLFKSITTRVALQALASAQAIDPGNVIALLKIREFWITVVTTVFAGLMMFNLRFWEEGQEATVIDVIVNMIMAFMATLQSSYSQRPAGATIQIVEAD